MAIIADNYCFQFLILACTQDGFPDARLSRSMRRGGQLTFPGLTNLHVTRTCLETD